MVDRSLFARRLPFPPRPLRQRHDGPELHQSVRDVASGKVGDGKGTHVWREKISVILAMDNEFYRAIAGSFRGQGGDLR
jgi:hypothetical protein